MTNVIYQPASYSEDCPEWIHARNMASSQSLLMALQAGHPELCPKDEPEPAPAPLPPISNEEIAKAADVAFPVYINRIVEVQRLILKEFPDLTIHDLKSVRRKKNQVLARQIAMYICKRCTNKSFPEIGRRFGGRDHSTICHAVAKIERLIKTNDNVAAIVERIESAIAFDER